MERTIYGDPVWDSYDPTVDDLRDSEVFDNDEEYLLALENDLPSIDDVDEAIENVGVVIRDELETVDIQDDFVWRRPRDLGFDEFDD